MKKDKNVYDVTKAKVRVEHLFPSVIAIKNLNLSNLKIIGKKFKKTFESDIKTTLDSDTLFNVQSMNYLNVELTTILSYLLKNKCKNFIFKLINIWINKYETNDYQGSHVHPGDYSFIIYYKSKKSYTVFNSPAKNTIERTPELIPNLFYRDWEPDLKQGDIIVFPSHLEHWVKPNSNAITIAGNIKIIKLIK